MSIQSGKRKLINKIIFASAALGTLAIGVLAGIRKTAYVVYADIDPETASWDWDSTHNWYYTTEQNMTSGGTTTYVCTYEPMPGSNNQYIAQYDSNGQGTLDVLCYIQIYNEDSDSFTGTQLTKQFYFSPASISESAGYYICQGTCSYDQQMRTFEIAQSYVSLAGSGDVYGWVVDETNNNALKYMLDSQTEGFVDWLYIEYRTEHGRDELELSCDIYDNPQKETKYFIDIPFQITSFTANPEFTSSDTSFSGTIEGWSDAVQKNVLVDISETISFLYVQDGWNYDGYHMALLYCDSDYTEDHFTLTAIHISEAGDATLTYTSDGQGGTRTMTLTEADYNSSADTITGWAELVDGEDSVEVLLSTSGIIPTDDNVQVDYHYGWNYDRGDQALIWYDPDYEDATYELSAVQVLYVDEEVRLTYEETSGSLNDEQTAVLANAEYDATTHTVQGDIDVDDDTNLDTITVNIGSVQAQKFQLWTYNNGFVWVEWDEGEALQLETDSLGLELARFYQHEDSSSDYLQAIFTYEGNQLPTIYLYGATYVVGTGQATGTYTFTGSYSELDLQSASLTLNVNDFITIPEAGWIFDSTSESFVYYYNSSLCRTTYVSGTLYDYGNERNRAELTYQATLPNEDTIQETFVLTNAATVTISGTEHYDRVSGVYDDRQIEVALSSDITEQFVPNIDYQGGFIYLYSEGMYEDCVITNVIYNDYGDEEYNFADLTVVGTDPRDNTVFEEVETITNASKDASPTGAGYSISGMWLGREVSVDVTEINTLNTLTTGWNYLNGYKKLVYTENDGTPHNVTLPGAIYDGRDPANATFDVSYVISDLDRDNTGSFTLTDAVIIAQPYDDPRQDGEIYGKWDTLGDTELYLTVSQLSSVEEAHWEYSQGEFTYVNPDSPDTYVEMVSCIYREDEGTMELNYNIYDPLKPEGYYDTATLNLTNVTVDEEYDEVNQEPGFATGTPTFIDGLEGISFYIYCTIQRPTPTPEYSEGWNYIDQNLVWYDKDIGVCDTSFDYATVHYTLSGTNEKVLEYAEIKYAVYGLDEQDLDRVTYKTIELTNVKVESEPNDAEEVPGILIGTYAPLQAELSYEFFSDQFEYKLIETEPEPSGEEDDDPATITPEQKEEIVDFLPEVEPTTPEEEKKQARTNESLEQLSEKTAAEILTTVTAAQNIIDQELEEKIASASSQKEKDQAIQEHKEKREIIETVTEASVVVGAAQQTATEEGKKITNALPKDGLDESMEKTLDDFYKKQMNYLLGKEEIPEKEQKSAGKRGNLRAPATNTTGINMNVSAKEYGKMIDFVDSAVSNMKDAALQIRKCSAASMKASVNIYISKVKVSSFRDFDEAAANAEFVAAIYKAIMLNMQQQVIDALEKDHEPSSNAEKERQYEEQLAACKDYDSFEQIVIEVLRLKYDSIKGEKQSYKDVDDFFENIYMPIFKSWALDDPSINPTDITLEELTTATIETTSSKASKVSLRNEMSKEEGTFLLVFGCSIGVVCLAGLGVGIFFYIKRWRLYR